MKIRTLALALAASAAITGGADAATRTFTISNGSFTDGGTFGGSLEYDDTAYHYSNVNIFAKGGVLTDYTYNDRDIDLGGNDYLGLDGSSTRYFSIAFSKRLSEALYSVPFTFGKGQEYNSDGDYREIKSGTLTIMAVPEPATWAMMLIGFSMIGATARYRRKARTVLFA